MQIRKRAQRAKDTYTVLSKNSSYNYTYWDIRVQRNFFSVYLKLKMFDICFK